MELLAIEDDGFSNLVGTSKAMRALRRKIRSLADVPTTVLITGETGTGKSEVARALHTRSSRSKAPFVHVDCAALAPTLVESELFGHEAGAFTDARTTRRGRLEAARGGTLFLDEIGDLARPLQAKLLRVLQDRTFERVGGTHSLRLEARIVAATNADLEAAVRDGVFRQDLYYRLHVARLHVPPLRERREDLPQLVTHAIRRLAARLAVMPPEPTDAFLGRLAEHPWPGNVRELLNVIERLLIQAPCERLEPHHAEEMLLLGPAALSSRPLDADAGRIAAALQATGGNVSRAARRLGLARSTLRYRIRKLRLGGLIPRD